MNYNKRNLFLYLFGQSVSKIGSGVLDFAIIWSVVLKFHSSIPFTVSILLTYVPKVILGIILNKLNFKFMHKRFIVFGDLLTAVFSFLFLFIGTDDLVYMYILVFFRAIGSGILEPYSNSIIVLLFNKEYYKCVNSLNSFLKSIVSITVPTVTSLILTVLDFKIIIFIDIVTAIINTIAVFSLKIINRSTENDRIEIEKKLSPLGKKILKINTAFYFFLTIPGFMTALLVKYYFGNNIAFLNLNETFWTSGMILGSLLTMKMPSNEFRMLAYSIISFGISIVLLSFSSNIYLYMTVITLSGITFPFYTANNNLAVQRNLNRNEVESYYIKESILSNMSIPLGIFLFGISANIVRINILFLFSGLVILTIGFIAHKILKI